jgi:hypothetical protein
VQPIRTTLIAFALASLLSGCRGSVTDAVEAASTTASSSSSGGAGGLPPSTCTFTLSGAIDATVVSDPSFTTVILGATLACGSLTGGVDESLLVAFGPPHGPGSYDSLTVAGYGYQHSSCPTSGCTDPENFGGTSASSGCVVQLTVAPAVEQVGDPIAGSFSCPAFVDDADPAKTVSITGSFSTVMHVPPD